MNANGNSEAEWQCAAFRSPRSSSIRPSSNEQPEPRQTSLTDYAEAMRNGVAFPPIDVFGTGDGTFYLGDGFHRRDAQQKAHPDVKDIECRVHPGDRDDALLFACGANAQHGLPRSRSDKFKAVKTLLRSGRWSEWSDREIARQCRGLAYVRRYTFAVNIWKRLQMPTGGARGLTPRRAPAQQRPGRRAGATTHGQPRRQALQDEHGAHRREAGRRAGRARRSRRSRS